jgi:plasmid maintenance system antidote protein VapI
MNTKLIEALSELDYDQSPEEAQRILDVLDQTRKAWLNMTQADYDRLVWQDERRAIERVNYEMNVVDE